MRHSEKDSEIAQGLSVGGFSFCFAPNRDILVAHLQSGSLYGQKDMNRRAERSEPREQTHTPFGLEEFMLSMCSLQVFLSSLFMFVSCLRWHQ